MRSADLVGKWELLSIVGELQDGGRLEPWGPNPSGQLVYSADGYFYTSAPTAALQTGIEEAFDATEVCAGRYDIDEGIAAVRHTVEISRMPNWQGTRFVRFPSFEIDRLTMRTPSMTSQGFEVVFAFVWQKARSAH